jgi:hypothetical protein
VIVVVVVVVVAVTQIKEAAISTGLVINESTTKHTKINRNITNLEKER